MSVRLIALAALLLLATPAQSAPRHNCTLIENVIMTLDKEGLDHVVVRDAAMIPWLRLIEWDEAVPGFLIIVFDEMNAQALIFIGTGESVCDLLQGPLDPAKAIMRRS